MNAETFLDATEALRLRFVKRISNGVQARIAARLKPNALVVAKLARSRNVSATARWNAAVTAAMADTQNRVKAIQQVDKRYPGLRLAMVNEANKRA